MGWDLLSMHITVDKIKNYMPGKITKMFSVLMTNYYCFLFHVNMILGLL